MAEASTTSWSETMVSTLADSLAENLIYFYSVKKYPQTQNHLDEWTQELLEHLQDVTTRSRDSSQDPDHAAVVVNAQEILDRAVAKAMDQWRNYQAKSEDATTTDHTKETTKKQGGSTSIFHQLDLFGAGGGLDSLVSLDQLQDAADLSERLVLLNKIPHIDDIMMDWPGFCPFLQQGLCLSSGRDEFQGYLTLHQAWFDQAKKYGGNLEYRDLQMDLCDNLLACLVQKQSVLPKEVAAVRQNGCWRTLHSMWMHFMMTGNLSGMDGRLYAVGQFMLECSKNMPSDPSEEVRIVQVDPCARWFTAWLAHLSPMQVLELVASRATTAKPTSSSISDALLCAVGYCRGCLTLRQPGQWQLDADSTKKYPVLRYALALLYPVLVNLRVALFPWGYLFDGLSRHDAIVILMTLYARMLQETNGKDDPNLTAICKDAMETIMSGTRGEIELMERLAAFHQ